MGVIKLKGITNEVEVSDWHDHTIANAGLISEVEDRVKTSYVGKDFNVKLLYLRNVKCNS